MDDAVARYAAALSAAAGQLHGVALVASYLHGSAALGGFAPGQSDIDVLLVVEAEPEPDIARSLGEALIAVAGCPGVGLEVSAVTRREARTPAPPWPFVVHATSAPHDRKVMVGPPAEQIIGPVAPDVLLGALRNELAWGMEHGSMAYAVLNATRALRYAHEHTLCSKLDGGAWAIAHGEPVDLISRALHAQRAGMATGLSSVERSWIQAVIDRL